VNADCLLDLPQQNAGQLQSYPWHLFVDPSFRKERGQTHLKSILAILAAVIIVFHKVFCLVIIRERLQFESCYYCILGSAGLLSF
jgi:hypothetical protein